MMLRKTLLATGLALVFCTAQAGDVIQINPDGVPVVGDPTLAVGSLGWNNGNAISLGVSGPITPTIPLGTIIQTYGQGALANFNNGLGNPIGSLGLNSAYEWTYVFGFQELVVPCAIGGGTCFIAIPGGNNFFNVYYDPSRNANNLAGTGFNDGTSILTGNILPFGAGPTGSGISNFAVSGVGSPLDVFNTNNYPGQTSTSGAGSSFFAAQITGFAPTFFITPPTVIQVTNNTFQNQPFSETDPSSCFWDGSAFIGGAGPGNFGGTCANAVGAINGISGPDIMFQTRASTSFVAETVPEPGSLALLGVGLALAGISRRRLARKAS